MPLPKDSKTRKAIPIFSGVLAYFPLALAEVAKCSKAGNDQHNPGAPLHWDRSKSGDELDALSRHLVDRASGEEFDEKGVRHLAHAAWRALAALQKELEVSTPKDMSEAADRSKGVSNTSNTGRPRSY